MIKSIQFTFVFVCLAIFSFAQESLNECGTAPYKSPFLKKYQANPAAYATRSDDLLMVPMTIHNIGNDSGSGYYNLNKILNAMCRLNGDFEESEIQFYIEGDIRYLDNSAYYVHDDVVEGGKMMFENNIENTINNYIVSRAAGNAGYNLPYAGIAMAKTAMGTNSSTWAHEVGHNLSLPHPFLGWEGGVKHDGSVPHNYHDPAPEFVTYDYTVFQSEFFDPADTLIVDTTFVEYLDGSNCNIAADGFCDTHPDYLNYRFDCDGSVSYQTQTDPSGATFVSDATLIMSYANDVCASRFTPEQIAAMRATLIHDKPELLNDLTPPAIVDEPVVLISPLDGDVVPFDELNISWEAVPNATTYFVEVSRLSDFTFIVHEEVTPNNYTTALDLQTDKDYFWRVRAYNKRSFCMPPSDIVKFRTGEFTSNENIELSNFSIYPTILSAGTDLTIKWENNSVKNLSMQIFNSAGALIKEEMSYEATGQGNYVVNTTTFTPGIYFVAINTDGKMERGKFVIY